jgi:hypothetical protein
LSSKTSSRTNGTEALTGVAPVPVAVVGPIDLELREYKLEEPEGRLVERTRAKDNLCQHAVRSKATLRNCAAGVARGSRAQNGVGLFGG